MSLSSAPGTSWQVRGLVVIAIVAVAVLVPPFVVRGVEVARGEPVGWRELLLIGHVTTAGLAILLGTLQLIPRIRRRRRMHRWIGRAFLLVGTLAFVVTGLPLALTVDNDVARAGLLVPPVLWPLFAAAGFTAIRSRDIARHRAWMLRLYALSFFAISARLIVPLLMLPQVPMLDSWYGGDLDRMLAATLPIGQWLGWIVNLAVVELILRKKSLAGSASASPRSPGGKRIVPS